MVEIVGLVPLPLARSNLRRALPRLRWGRPACGLRFVNSWAELHREVSPPFDGLVVLDPSSHTLHSCSDGELNRVRETSSVRGVVVYGAFSHETTGANNNPWVADFPVLVKLGIDDHPDVLLRALAAAESSRPASDLWSSLSVSLNPACAAFLRMFFLHWPRASSVRGLCQRLRESDRSLRRHATACSLPPPCRILRSVSLLDALALWALGVKSPSRIAYLLGYSDSSSLSRGCRNLTGEPLRSFLAPGGISRLMAALRDALDHSGVGGNSIV